MTTYQPKYPRTVAGEGFNYRRVLASPRCERLSKRMDVTYRTVDLEPDDRFRLLELHRELMRGYSKVDFARQFQALGDTPSRLAQTERSKGAEMVKAVELAYAAFLDRIGVHEGVS